MSFVWSEEIKANLYKELEYDLDNKKFFNAKDYYSTKAKSIESTENSLVSLSNITYEKKTSIKSFNFENTVKGMSFSNTLETPIKTKSIDDLSLEDRKIYKITDLLSANLAETIVIPYNVQNNSLALIKKFDWKDVLFADIGTAWRMVKSKFNW